MKVLHNLIPRRGALRVLQLAVGCIAFCASVTAQAAEEHPPQDDWFTAYFVEGYGFLVLFVVAIAALLIFRKLRSRGAYDPFVAKGAARVEVQPQPAPAPAENRKPASAAASRDTEPRERRAIPREPASADYANQAFGAYRIDQEVGKLVLGKPHRMDVLASRVPEGRRAIEASLINCLGSSRSEEHT